jgi:hypothetical protein
MIKKLSNSQKKLYENPNLNEKILINIIQTKTSLEKQTQQKPNLNRRNYKQKVKGIGEQIFKSKQKY